MIDSNKKVILVTNREPYIHDKNKNEIEERRAVGGVVTALDPLMKKNGGVWIAWGSGSADFELCETDNKIMVPYEEKKYTLKRVKLTKSEEELYYKGYANQVLWPLFHIFIEKVTIDDSFWDAYFKVNKKFAKSIIEEIDDDSVIWIHDYHLALVPKMIKDKIPNAKIAYFWHIPWPPWEIFGSLPQREQILSGLLNTDLIGFHTKSYVKNFLSCCKRKVNTTVYKDKVVSKDSSQSTKVVSAPLGIHFNSYAKYEMDNEEREHRIEKKFINSHKNEFIILGIDRLDYTKGILNRLKAFEYFLENNKEFHERVTLIQIATPSRYEIDEYHDMKKNIDETVGRINAKFRTVEWTPVEYFFRRIPQDELIMYYQLSDIALLTPIRDGMNLITKEYIAARKKPGVLILSEFAGASEELTEAIIVNPYDLPSTAEAIKTAINMPEIEKENRFKALKQKVLYHDSSWWLKDFLNEWNNMYDSNEEKIEIKH